MVAWKNQVVRLWRPWFWLPALAPAYAGALWTEGVGLSCGEGLLLFLALGPGICGFAEAVNDIFDIEIDRGCKRKEFFGVPLASGSGVLLEEGGPQLARKLSVVSAAVAMACGAMLSMVCLYLVVIGLVLAWAYSAPPIRAKMRYGLGSFLQGMAYGPVAFFLGLASAGGTFSGESVLAAILMGLWVASVGLTADVLDADDDRRHGIKTLAVLLGRSGSALFVAAAGTSCLVGGALIRSSPAQRVHPLLVCVGIAFTGLAFVLFFYRNKCLPTAAHVLALVLEAGYPAALLMGM